ncbi:MAG TPA: CHAD domain-containing protein [Steroidobacteraceae bacterium]|nr:CHAD domain-containing protein [Steroidobacteraceae bacterium]
MEWQLACTDLGPVRRWLSDHVRIGGLILEPRSTQQILDTYFDTDDWRIHRAGYALRIRSESGRSEASLKSLHSASTEVADRRELSEPLKTAESVSICRSDGPVGARVHAVSGAHPLQPLFEVRTSRQRFAIHSEHEQQELGEIALDDTVISRPHGEPRASLQRVEVEALGDAREPLQELVRTLRSDCALEAAADTKYSTGLKSVGLAPAPALRFAPTSLSPAMRIDEVPIANLRRHVSAWHQHEPGARLGDDPENLHDLRVAGRKLDATLREFRHYVPPALLRIRPTLKTTLRALGEARDFDVALSELESFGRELPDAERAGLEPLRRHLAAERVRARERMIAQLDSPGVLKDLGALTAAVTATAHKAMSDQSVLEVAPELIRARYRKVRKGADRLTPRSSMEAYHAVRGRVKKLRYALESVAVIYGKPADEMLRALRRWQEKLGAQQDAHVAGQRLQALAAHPPAGVPPETLFLMGRLAEHHASTAARARKSLAKAQRKVRRRWKALKSRLEELQPRAAATAATD